MVAPTPPRGMPKVVLGPQVAQSPAGHAESAAHPPSFAAASAPATNGPAAAPAGASRPGRSRPESVPPVPPPPPVPVAPIPASKTRDPADPVGAPAARGSSPGSAVTCPTCGTSNPPMYRFCVTCGVTLPREAAKSPQPITTDRPAAPAPQPSGPSPVIAMPAGSPSAGAQPAPAPSQPGVAQPVPAQPAVAIAQPVPAQPSVAHPAPAQPTPASSAQAQPPMVLGAPSVAASPAPIPERLEERIIGSPVVEIAPGSAPQKPIVCPRCQGQCIPAARFCQFCGAPLPGAGAAPAQAGAAPIAPAAAPPRASDPEPQRAPATGREAPVASAPAAARGASPQARGRLVVIEADGTEGMSFPLADRPLDVGRLEGDILVKEDPYVSPRHARLVPDGARWLVRDLASTNGIYLRLKKQYLLQDADLLLLGQEVLQFQLVSEPEKGLGHANQHGTLLFGSPITSRSARLCQRTVEGIVRDVYYLHRDETVIGRETGDIVFTADPFLSRRHAMIRRTLARKDGPGRAEEAGPGREAARAKPSFEDGAAGRDGALRPRPRWDFNLTDLDSSNGTFVAIRNEVALQHGDFVRVGQHLFRVDFA